LSYDARSRSSYTARILNTEYRCAAERIPYSVAAFPPQGSTGADSNLGAWSVDELQICQMGSRAPDGAYVRVAGCDLRPAVVPGEELEYNINLARGASWRSRYFVWWLGKGIRGIRANTVRGPSILL
jgi:hypothetical protein